MAYQFGVGEYVDNEGDTCVVNEVFEKKLFGRCFAFGEWIEMSWDADGTGYGDYRLLPPKQKRTYWINIYPDDIANEAHRSPASAKGGRGFNSHAIACKEVTFEFTPGEGLD